MLKSLTIFLSFTVLAVSVMTTSLVAPAWCAGPDWVLIDTNEASRFFYDQSGTKEPSKGVIQVATRVVYTEKGRAEALKILQGEKKFDKLFETRYLHDLDCKKEQSRLLEARHLDKEGITLKSTDLAAATEWEEIPPEARMGLVMEKLCTSQPAR